MDKNKYGKLFFINRIYMFYMMENIYEDIYFYVDYVVVLMDVLYVYIEIIMGK